MVAGAGRPSSDAAHTRACTIYTGPPTCQDEGMVRASPLGRVALGLALAAALGLAAARLAGFAVPIWSLALAGAALAATVLAGVFWLGSGVFARPILEGPPAAGRLALTFDDGPDPVCTRAVLDLLDARGHRATFFVIGERAAANAELCAEIARRGHGLGNHSLAHARSTPFHSAPRLASELRRAGETLARAAGRAPRWFRPPVGLISPPVAAAARAVGLELVGWTATARDGVAGATVEAALGRLERALKPGAILVLHDAAERGGHAPIAAAVLGPLLDRMEARGLKSVTLDELLGGS